MDGMKLVYFRNKRKLSIRKQGSWNHNKAKQFSQEITERKEAVVQRCSVIKVFLEISQNSQENTCARVSFLIKLQA